jgi:hypothetical protein
VSVESQTSTHTLWIDWNLEASGTGDNMLKPPSSICIPNRGMNLTGINMYSIGGTFQESVLTLKYAQMIKCEDVE